MWYFDQTWNLGKCSKIKSCYVVLVYCYLLKNDFQREWKVLYTAVPNKSFKAINTNILKNFIRTFEFSGKEILYTGENSRLVEIENRA